MDTCLNEEGPERKAGLTSEDTATIGLVALAVGLLLAGADYLTSRNLAPGSYDARIFPAAAVVMMMVTALASINLNRFKKSLFELIALPSPLYGLIVSVVVSAIEVGKLFHFDIFFK